ncbi:hypothetical protein REPUB_Repub05bG0081600 [Reevesia pubescens]
MVQSINSGWNEDSLVEDLLNKDRRDWNRDLVASLFFEKEADLICLVPISRLGLPDVLMWYPNNKDVYTVKTAYRKLCGTNQGDVTTTPGRKDVWRKLWLAEVPNKIQVMMWRGVSGVLLVLANLMKRKMNIEEVCFRCMEGLEDELHACKDCSAISNV